MVLFLESRFWLLGKEYFEEEWWVVGRVFVVWMRGISGLELCWVVIFGMVRNGCVRVVF